MPHHFFVPPENITPPTVTLPSDIAKQLRTVLRMNVGDQIVVLDGQGHSWQVALTEVEKNRVCGALIAPITLDTEPTLQITLYQGTMKGQKFEWVLQKGTELGVSRFVPVLCQRSIVNRASAVDDKRERWLRIVTEAAEQSRRLRVPAVTAAMPFKAAVEQAISGHDVTLIPWEEEVQSTPLTALMADQPRRIALFIGPEGGFAAEEVAQSRSAGAYPIRLGPRILRAETAGLAVVAAIMALSGEW